jgi:pyridoxal 5'-phosphate synthase pdxT subunit
MTCGVLALQGDWQAHIEVLRELGVAARPVRTAAEFKAVDRLVLPGGESTSMLRLLEAGGLRQIIHDRIAAGLPTLATCAGIILLARRVTPDQVSLGLLDIDVERNAYGRQVASAVTEVHLETAVNGARVLEGVFIRAPRIVRAGPEVEILARLGDQPVLVRQGAILAATFHPELTTDRRVHRLFLATPEETDG